MEADMKPAVVTGQIRRTVRTSGLARIADGGNDRCPGNLPTGSAVAIDSIGAGTGEWVPLVSGSSARQHRSELSPVDLCVIGTSMKWWLRKSGFP